MRLGTNITEALLDYMSQPKKGKEGKVYYSKILLVVGIVCSALFMISMVLCAFSEEDRGASIVFLLLSLLGVTLIIMYINCRIYYDEYKFVVKNFFGIKREYSYEEITGINYQMSDVRIFVGERQIAIDKIAIGGHEFVEFVKKRYRIRNEGRAIPIVRKLKHDLFNGHVKDPEGFIVSFVVMALIPLFLTGLFVWSVFFDVSTPENTDMMQSTFDSCAVYEDEIVLMSDDREIYKVWFDPEIYDVSRIEAICDGETAYDVYYIKVTPEDAEPYYSVKAIQNGEDSILSFDETNEMHKKSTMPYLLIPAGMAVIIGVTIACTIVVGRNPKKFGKKVVGLFFKDGYVNY